MDFALETEDWKKDAYLIKKSGRRNIYAYNGVIVKEINTIRWNNLNLLDYKNYQLLEKIISGSDFERNFVKIYYENNYIISEIVKDFDGSISQNLLKYDGVITENFWKILENLLQFLIRKNIYFFDLNKGNVLVKRVSKDEIIPIFFDYKSYNKKYFLQLNLLFKSEREKKVWRRFERLKEKVN